MSEKSNLIPEKDLLQTNFQEIVDLIDHLNKKFFRLCNGIVTQHGITPQQYSILRYLWKKDGVPLNELAISYCTSRSTITGVVDSLEKKELIKREFSLNDRRVIYVQLTEKGKKFQSKNIAVLSAIEKKCKKLLNSKKKRQLAKLLNELNSVINL